jgi:glyoxylase-like metal-dependent hydrolase (beta-lactamase superfamily II)
VQQRADENQLPVFPRESEPELLEEGIYRIPVPLPFALRSANIYLLADGPAEWTLVDAGLGLTTDESALLAGLAFAGITMAQISNLILTHCHPDHIGLSGPIHAASGAPVYMLDGEAHTMYQVWGQEAGGANEALAAMYLANGMTPDQVASGRQSPNRTRSILKLPPPKSIVPLEDGAELRLGNRSYQIIWTPGHSDHHLCLLRDDQVFIAGDHILPGITPNIGRYPHGRPDPLRDYFWGLERVRDLPVRLVLPGHRLPFVALAERVDELEAHHRERSEAIYALLAGAEPLGMSAAGIAQSLFGKRLRTSDDLRFAFAESLAHLEYLCSEGRAATHQDNEQIVYTAIPAARLSGT